jgi:hypothetical protein
VSQVLDRLVKADAKRLIKAAGIKAEWGHRVGFGS